jgi:hypothetical protein
MHPPKPHTRMQDTRRKMQGRPPNPTGFNLILFERVKPITGH